MKIKNQIINLMLALALTFTAFSCSDDDKVEIAKLPTVLEIAQADSANFSVLIKALQVTGLTASVSSPGSITVFAPTNAAFAAESITEASLQVLADNPTLPANVTAITSLRNILRNHILGVGTKANDLLASRYVKTFATGPGTTTLSMLVLQSGTDVLINGGATNGGTKVTKADIDASNGIVHVVENVIKLPKILNHVIANPDLSTLVSVVTSTSGTFGNQAAVATALGGNGPLTVFAPLNSAFTAATTGSGFLTGASLTAANVTKVLQYHVSSTGNLTSSSSVSWTPNTTITNATITTLAQNSVPAAQTFLITQGTVKLTELPVLTGVAASNIKVVNIQATNGVIHTIDRVLQPVF